MITTFNFLTFVLCQINAVHVEGNIFLNWHPKLFLIARFAYLPPRTKFGPTLISPPPPPLPPYYSLNANLIKQANFNLHTLNNKEPLATLRFILKRLEAEILPLNKPDITEKYH